MDFVREVAVLANQTAHCRPSRLQRLRLRDKVSRQVLQVSRFPHVETTSHEGFFAGVLSRVQLFLQEVDIPGLALQAVPT